MRGVRYMTQGRRHAALVAVAVSGQVASCPLSPRAVSSVSPVQHVRDTHTLAHRVISGQPPFLSTLSLSLSLFPLFVVVLRVSATPPPSAVPPLCRDWFFFPAISSLCCHDAFTSNQSLQLVRPLSNPQPHLLHLPSLCLSCLVFFPAPTD